MSFARAIDATEDDTITKDIVDAVAADVKEAGLQL
jgi:hypothetical protein